MNHPLLNNLDNFNNNELHDKINDLTKKYWQTNNIQVKNQISLALETIKEELGSRKKNERIDNNDVDNLIKIS